jgi:ribosomal subunit interface protein
MKIEVIGSNMQIGNALTQHVNENLTKGVTKYFDGAIGGQVFFTKKAHLVSVVINVNEGIKGGGIVIKSDSEAGDPYGAFAEALKKAEKQLRRYKRKIKNYRRQGGGLKSLEPDYKAFEAIKYVMPPSDLDVFEEMEEEVLEEQEQDKKLNIVAEKNTAIENLTVSEAIMKMDLANLPALVFINSDNKRINVVYHRKDGNISWVDPQI